MKRITLLATLGLLIAACGGNGGGIEVSDARLGQPTGPNAALYFTATGGGTADRLLGAMTDVAASVEIHESSMGDDGAMSMQPVDRLDLPADDDLVLEPGGYHLMLLDVDRLEVGDTVEVTLSWEQAGAMTIEAEVVAPGDTMGDDEMDMGDEGSDG
ncbi:MAG: copper chaperone PCu(A)C [Acidimicrobiia bacterium]|jgi:copper(I)-binding protein